MTTAEQIIVRLKKTGCKMTRARIAIVEILAGRDLPLSVSDLLTELGKRKITVDKTTVYREFAVLTEKGVVREVQFGDGAKRYELGEEGSHHHHLVCTDCGTVEDVRLAGDLEREERRITAKSGFQILSHSLEFFGLCVNCHRGDCACARCN